MMAPRSCVGADGRFIVGIHKPCFDVDNLRENAYIAPLGRTADSREVDNRINFPKSDLHEPAADTIYEIANAFAFRGTSYINSAWADPKADDPAGIQIPAPESCSYIKNIKKSSLNNLASHEKKEILDVLPRPLLIALAQASTDPEELILLAEKSCCIHYDGPDRTPSGIGYNLNHRGRFVPDIYDHELFEVLVNNPHLPDAHKNALVLKPGVQGGNEITGEYISADGRTHVFEYLRRNSYIPWGHFASNMANDAIRYSANSLSTEDMAGIRHLYYQRAYARTASQLGIDLPGRRRCLTCDELEKLRQKIVSEIGRVSPGQLEFNNTLWGWNFGFGYAQSGHRLHASHQMIHQQNAMIPGHVKTQCGKTVPAFACGDMIQEFITRYREATGCGFFTNYLSAIKQNTRTDGRNDRPDSLVVAEDEHTILFVPKAPISEWELQLMPKSACGNIIEAGSALRNSLDAGILAAVKTLETMGAKMVTAIEFSKAFNADCQDQHLLYSFIPRLPYAPGTFSEAQLRWISGCYPEDVAHACREALGTQNKGGSYGSA